MPKKQTTEDFIKKAVLLHGNKYDYTKTDLNNKDERGRVCITCPIHGDFWQLPANHIHKSHPRGCPSCNGGVKKSTEEFIEKARKIHNDRWDYSKTDLNNKDERGRVCITCPIHGDFWQLPANHIHKSHPRGCPSCNGGIAMTMDEFLERSKKVHGDKYIYDKVDLNNRDEKGRVCIICPEHGEFWQHPARHSKGEKCKYCARVGKLTTDEFIKRSKIKHNNKYIYDKTEYTIQSDYVIITCPKHGDFKQNANSHLHGAGCPHCHMSRLEIEIEKFLNENNIKYKHIVTKKDFDWLGRMSLDFYLPEYNSAIECQGIQHFKKVDVFEDGKYGLKHTQKCDKKKKILCDKNSLKLFYYSNLGIEYPYTVYEDKEKLLKEIKNGNKIQN